MPRGSQLRVCTRAFGRQDQLRATVRPKARLLRVSAAARVHAERRETETRTGRGLRPEGIPRGGSRRRREEKLFA